jgi:hypothetical protein
MEFHIPNGLWVNQQKCASNRNPIEKPKKEKKLFMEILKKSSHAFVLVFLNVEMIKSLSI